MFAAATGLIVAGFVAVSRLEAHVDRLLVGRGVAVVEFADLPSRLAELAEADLYDRVADLRDRPWTDDRLCRDVSARVSASGWVAKVNHVRRTSDARFEVSCRYRLPAALVQQDAEFFLVDETGVRLPGVYRYDSSWHIIQGVGLPAPQPGVLWEGQDLRGGLDVLRAVEAQPFSGQITAVLVANFDGRADPRRSHTELATDQAGGRIRWGSAPGQELEENSVSQKIAILLENFRRTGRVDAHHPVIDISTFPDRFTIPG